MLYKTKVIDDKTYHELKKFVVGFWYVKNPVFMRVLRFLEIKPTI